MSTEELASLTFVLGFVVVFGAAATAIGNTATASGDNSLAAGEASTASGLESIEYIAR